MNFHKRIAPKALFALAGLSLLESTARKTLESCGIACYIGHRPIAVEVIMSGLEDLQNRGYDSAGVVTLHADEARITKYASDPFHVSDSIHKVKSEALSKQQGSYIGIGHTRWATHGGKTDLNAHPHTDHNNRIYLVHNGTISNTSDIIKFLASHNISPKTETDTELIACLIGLYMDEGHGVKQAVETVLSKLTGTWGLAVLDKDNPHSIIVARKGSPIHIGVRDREFFIASEPSAFAQYTEKYYSLEEDEIVEVNIDKTELEVNKLKSVPLENLSSSLGQYLHWTEKEINEQPESVARAMNFGARLFVDTAKLGGLERYREEFLKIENLLILGCGTSLYAAMFGASIFNRLGLLKTVVASDASDLTVYDIPRQSPGAIAISQSGETWDVISAVQKLKASNVPTISIVNVVASTLAQLTQHGVYMNSGREVAVASTKSFMNSCVILTEIALWASKQLKPEDTEIRKQIINDLSKLPLKIGSVIAHANGQCAELGKKLANSTSMFVLGRGSSESIAKEGALKIKEISYIHAEGFAAGALKHGPFALIREGTPVILILLNDEYKEVMINAFEQVHSRGARVVVITPDPALLTTVRVPYEVIQIEEAGILTPLLAVVPLQLLAYYLSISNAYNPDTPRNLAKVVTVSG